MGRSRGGLTTTIFSENSGSAISLSIGIWTVAFSPYGRTAVPGSSDNTIRFSDVAGHREIGVINGQAGVVFEARRHVRGVQSGWRLAGDGRGPHATTALSVWPELAGYRLRARQGAAARAQRPAAAGVSSESCRGATTAGP
jgi:WD40 repeat protein